MNVIIMHQTVTNHDAIGNDIELMYRILQKGNDCYIYAQNQLNQNVRYIDDESLKSILEDEQSLIIYHHSGYWEKGEEIIRQTKGRIIFRYHNITPEEFFEPYHEFSYLQCKMGREQTDRFMEMYPDSLWLSDSDYNSEDLTMVIPERIAVCAPFNKIEEWTKIDPDENILKSLIESDEINLLFVGRIAPNKNHLFLLEILRIYLLNYDNKIKLRIIGKFDSSLDGYNKLINKKINEYKLNDYVEFVGEINDRTLAAYYLGSDLYVCASEHEGFCVPILEAQSLRLPIISLDCCAVPDTGGRGQILLEKDAKQFAAAIRILTDHEGYYAYFQEEGIRNYNRYLYENLEHTFVEQIQQYYGGKS